ncbi:MAG: hypothetical protein MK033_07340 [Candidatus Caenarcaniphilales bacterium]|nr:hypothetical protein [Candidatus Caenarcaniphilales bacterium]
MAKDYTILHNPRCGKSRAALKLIEEKKLKVSIHEYLNEGITQKLIKEILTIADFELEEMIRKKEAKELDLDLNQSKSELIKLISANPKILQRPIVFTDKKAVIARDDEWFSRIK